MLSKYKWLLLLLFLVAILLPYAVNSYVAKEVKRIQDQAIHIRILNETEQAKLFLAEEGTKQGLTIFELRLLSRIISCESGWNPHAENALSHDFGYFQINRSSWNEKAKEMGLEYQTNWRHNILMGLYIYKTQGLRAWEWSKYSCWGT